MKDSEKSKKQVPLRLSPTLYAELSRWAEDDFRSINGQIEFLLTECVKKCRKSRSRAAEGASDAVHGAQGDEDGTNGENSAKSAEFDGGEGIL